MDVVAEQLEIDIEPAETNALQPRLDAVDHFLSDNLPDGQPGLIMDYRSKDLRKAMMSGYQFKRIKDVQTERYTDKPDKSVKWADIADGLEYAAVYQCGEAALHGRKIAREESEGRRRAEVDRTQRRSNDNWGGDALAEYR